MNDSINEIIAHLRRLLAETAEELGAVKARAEFRERELLARVEEASRQRDEAIRLAQDLIDGMVQE